MTMRYMKHAPEAYLDQDAVRLRRGWLERWSRGHGTRRGRPADLARPRVTGAGFGLQRGARYSVRPRLGFSEHKVQGCRRNTGIKATIGS